MGIDRAEDMEAQNRFAGKPHGPIIRTGGVKVRLFLPNHEFLRLSSSNGARPMSCTFGVAGYLAEIRKSETKKNMPLKLATAAEQNTTKPICQTSRSSASHLTAHEKKYPLQSLLNADMGTLDRLLTTPGTYPGVSNGEILAVYESEPARRRELYLEYPNHASKIIFLQHVINTMDHKAIVKINRLKCDDDSSWLNRSQSARSGHSVSRSAHWWSRPREHTIRTSLELAHVLKLLNLDQGGSEPQETFKHSRFRFASQEQDT
ncbi:hypothetical protein GX51_06284 [Blastomyces parvus]|uniref:Uncharacterized protein n=1 Tax=Blastomyces parvus TaxID=2060905 RepID=A0A2B7WSB3_9EURO|nr:hypothetical protein GX51_06284 [Blastomyces parvus]